MGNSGWKDLVTMPLSLASPSLSCLFLYWHSVRFSVVIIVFHMLQERWVGVESHFPDYPSRKNLTVPTDGLLSAHHLQQSAPFRVALTTESHLTKVMPFWATWLDEGILQRPGQLGPFQFQSFPGGGGWGYQCYPTDHPTLPFCFYCFHS